MRVGTSFSLKASIHSNQELLGKLRSCLNVERRMMETADSRLCSLSVKPISHRTCPGSAALPASVKHCSRDKIQCRPGMRSHSPAWERVPHYGPRSFPAMELKSSFRADNLEVMPGYMVLRFRGNDLEAHGADPESSSIHRRPDFGSGLSSSGVSHQGPHFFP